MAGHYMRWTLALALCAVGCSSGEDQQQQAKMVTTSHSDSPPQSYGVMVTEDEAAMARQMEAQRAMELEAERAREQAMRQQADSARAIQPRMAVKATGSSQSAMSGATAAEPPTAAPPTNAVPGEEDTSEAAVVRVFYATDRAGQDRVQPTWWDYLALLRNAVIGLAAVLLVGMLWQWKRGAPLTRWVRLALASVPLALAAVGALDCLALSDNAKREGREFGNGRGHLELGHCEVSVPRIHRTGELEGPSLLRFEFKEDTRKHVVLLSTDTLPASEFHDELAEQMAASTSGDAFVFVHGYNVSFDDAARRAAQLAYDLPYTGTPILFSWPSQAGVLQYPVDENNAEWAAPHLKALLADLVAEHGGERVNLIAHSMGNRVLTGALRLLAAEREPPKFREIVLAAPDIDADIFRRDIGPVLTKVAHRVTLYASSKDDALALSKSLHGAPRAGDSGDLLTLVPGIDTIDVSVVDTSLLGHSYYGNSVTVLDDLFHLLGSNLPPEERTWLTPDERDGMRFWVLQRALLEQAARQRQHARR